MLTSKSAAIAVAMVLAAASGAVLDAPPSAASKPAAATSPFVGSYEGALSTTKYESWTVTIDVNASGQISGSAVFSRWDEYNPYPIYTATGTARGSVSGDGGFDLRLAAGRVRESHSGQAYLQTDGSLALAYAGGGGGILARR